MATDPAGVIAIFGPTAVGKTAFALEVAGLLDAEGTAAVAVSTDAYQLYRGLETITGAPSPEERQRLEHRLVGSHDVTVEMSAGLLASEARAAISEALAEGVQPIVIGGAGLYMQATLTELDLRPPVGTDGHDAKTPDELHDRLALADAGAAAQISPSDRYRTGRALALARAGERVAPGTGFWEAPLWRPTALFGLVRPREELYRRIDERIDRMVEAGAAAEVAALQDTASATARKAIGFAELPEGRIDEMKRRTRRYAKRQLTWLRRIPAIEVIDLSAQDEADAAARVVAAARDLRQ